MIGNHVEIDPTADIRASEVIIGDYVTIGARFKALVSGRLEIGACTTIESDVSFIGRDITIGDYCYFKENVVIGGGRSMSENSIVKIGRGCLICENVLINNAEQVTIGNEVGIGKEVDIWTHGGFLNILEGFPNYSAPVSIGNHVWIPSRTTILAGVVIEDNVVIGNHSLVNRSLPSGCFAAGVPANILVVDYYPQKYTYIERQKIIQCICNEYEKIMEWKGFDTKPTIVTVSDYYIKFGETMFDLERMAVSSELDDYAEDFRDHLRRYGIKFYTGKPFKSIMPEAFGKIGGIQ